MCVKFGATLGDPLRAETGHITLEASGSRAGRNNDVKERRVNCFLNVSTLISLKVYCFVVQICPSVIVTIYVMLVGSTLVGV